MFELINALKVRELVCRGGSCLVPAVLCGVAYTRTFCRGCWGTRCMTLLRVSRA